MNLLLRNRPRDQRIELLRRRIDELLSDAERGRTRVKDKLTELQELQDHIEREREDEAGPSDRG